MAAGRAAGFRPMFIYMGLESSGLSRMRVVERVENGGHHVPGVDIIRRYPASLANLAVALGLAERSWMLDNSASRRRLLLIWYQGRNRYLSTDLPDWAVEAIPEHLRAFG